MSFYSCCTSVRAELLILTLSPFLSCCTPDIVFLFFFVCEIHFPISFLKSLEKLYTHAHSGKEIKILEIVSYSMKTSQCSFCWEQQKIFKAVGEGVFVVMAFDISANGDKVNVEASLVILFWTPGLVEREHWVHFCSWEDWLVLLSCFFLKRKVNVSFCFWNT